MCSMFANSFFPIRTRLALGYVMEFLSLQILWTFISSISGALKVVEQTNQKVFLDLKFRSVSCSTVSAPFK